NRLSTYCTSNVRITSKCYFIQSRSSSVSERASTFLFPLVRNMLQTLMHHSIVSQLPLHLRASTGQIGSKGVMRVYGGQSSWRNSGVSRKKHGEHRDLEGRKWTMVWGLVLRQQKCQIRRRLRTFCASQDQR